MLRTNCGCSPRNGACDEHKAQSALASSVADAMTEADEVAITAAIETLGAVEVGTYSPDGGATIYRQYAFRRSAKTLSRPGTRWYVATDDALTALPGYLDTMAAVERDRADGYEYARSGDAYGVLGVGPALWLARWGERHSVVRMPSWWSPEQRCAFTYDGLMGVITHRYVAEDEARAAGKTLRCITADLTTGAEVPA